MKFNNNLDGKTGTNFAPFFHERQQTCSSALLSADKQALCTAANVSASAVFIRKVNAVCDCC